MRPVLGGNPNARTVADCQRYVDAIVGSDWWTARCRRTRIVVDDGRGRRYAWARWDGKIVLPRWARTEETILHELAHHLAGLDANHGPRYRGAHVALVRRFRGPEHARRLVASYDAKPRQRWRGNDPKPFRAPVRQTCAGCGKTARRLGWVARLDGTSVRVRFHSRECGTRWFADRLSRADV